MSDFIDESSRKDHQPALGQVLRDLRQKNGDLPLSALARRASVDPRLLEQIEAGEGGDWETISKLRRALGVGAQKFAELHEAAVKEEEMEGVRVAEGLSGERPSAKTAEGGADRER